MSGVVYRPAGKHTCTPGVSYEPWPADSSTPPPAHSDSRYAVLPRPDDYPRGTVWQCDCGQTWVSQGLQGGGRQRSGGYAAAALEWKRESRRARRKRERQGITPEMVFGAAQGTTKQGKTD